MFKKKEETRTNVNIQFTFDGEGKYLVENMKIDGIEDGTYVINGALNIKKTKNVFGCAKANEVE